MIDPLIFMFSTGFYNFVFLGLKVVIIFTQSVRLSITRKHATHGAW